MKNKTNYLVTFASDEVSTEEAKSILGLNGRNVIDGVSQLSGDEIPKEKDILNFQHMGIAALELTEQEAEKLRKNKNVLAVEEDTEMHILEIEDEENGEPFFDVDEESAFDSNEESSFGVNEDYNYQGEQMNDSASSYQKGVSDAIAFIISSLTYGRESSLGISFPGSQTPDTLSHVQPIPWNINLVRAPFAWARGTTGLGVRVAILDTGIAAHPDLVISGGVSFIPGVVSYHDGHGHGTHCAGIAGARNNAFGVVGVAPRSMLYAVKVLSNSGSGSTQGVIAGMDWCRTHGIKVISMSLGSNSEPSVAYAQAVKRCQDAGITVVVAAGNSFGSVFPWVGSPANSIATGTPNASPIAVGSIGQNLVISPFSSRGGRVPLWNQVTVVAPGSLINSTIPGGYGIKSGTSMACPHVAGAVALIKQKFPALTPAQIKARLRATARDLGPAGVDIAYGSGLIDCNRATL